MIPTLPPPETAVFVLSVLVKGAVVLGLTAGLSWMLRQRAAAYRHAVWALGLGVVLLLPAAEATLPHWSPSWAAPFALSSPDTPTASAEWDSSAPETSPLRISPGDRTPRQTQPDRSSSGTLLSENRLDGRSASSSASEDSRPDGNRPEEHALHSAYAQVQAFWSRGPGQTLLRAVPWVWGLGILVVLGWIVAGLLQVRGWIRQGERLTGADWTTALEWARTQIDVPRSIALYRSPDVSVPMTAGVFRPVILLPATAQEWSMQRRRTVLLHEMVHAKRGDCVTNLIGQLACAVHWVNPLVWRAARRLRTERERACDDRVLAAGVSAPDYADHLVAVAREMVGRQRLSGALSMARPSELKSRIQSILSRSGAQTLLSRRHGVALATVLLVAVLPLAALRPPPAQTARTIQAPPQTAPSQGVQTFSPRSAFLGSLFNDTLETPDTIRMRVAPPVEGSAVSHPEDPSEADAIPNGEPPTSDEEASSASAPTAPTKASGSQKLSGSRPTREVASPEPPSSVASDTTDEDEERRELQEQAVYAISQLPSEQAAPRLLKIARTHPNTEIREMALRMLGRHKHTSAIGALGEIARTDTSQDVRQAAVYALGQIYAGGEEVTDEDLQALKRLATNIEDPEVGAMAIRALSEVKTEAAVPILVDIATSDAPLEVRQAAVRALGEIGDPRAAEALMQIANEN